MDYVAKPYPGRVTLFRTRARPLLHACRPDAVRADLGWGKVAQGGVEVFTTRALTTGASCKSRSSDRSANNFEHGWSKWPERVSLTRLSLHLQLALVRDPHS